MYRLTCIEKKIPVSVTGMLFIFLLLVPATMFSQDNHQPGSDSDMVFKFSIDSGVTLLMPFDFERNLKPDTSDLAEQEITTGSLPWINFYEGMKLAADSLADDSAAVHIDVFDSAVDSAKLVALLKQPNVFKNKILIAVVPAWIKPLLEKLASKNQVDLFYVQNDAGKLALTRGSLTPTNRMMICEMSDWIVGQFKTDQIIIVHRENAKEKMLADLFNTSIDSCSKKSITPVLVNYSVDKAAGLQKRLLSTKRNCIIIASSDEAWVSPVVNALADTVDLKSITVCGLPTWHTFESVDIQNLMRLNLHYFIYEWIDYNNPEINHIRQQFVNRYLNDPSFSAFQGYYFAKGIFHAIRKKNSGLLNNISDFNACFNPVFFRFRTTADSTMGNTATSVLMLSEFSLIRVN